MADVPISSLPLANTVDPALDSLVLDQAGAVKQVKVIDILKANSTQGNQTLNLTGVAPTADEILASSYFIARTGANTIQLDNTKYVDGDEITAYIPAGAGAAVTLTIDQAQTVLNAQNQPTTQVTNVVTLTGAVTAVISRLVFLDNTWIVLV